MRPDPDALAEWVARQRWYPGKPNRPELSVVKIIDLPSSEPDVECASVLVAEAIGCGQRRLYQVPLVRRSAAGAASANVVQSDGDLVLVDAIHDPSFAASALAASGVQLDAEELHESRPLAVEQSNSSLVVRRTTGSPLMLKVFRVIQPGANPDAELLSALSGTTPRLVPRFDGRFRAAWTKNGTQEQGDLMLVEEFADGAADAWSCAMTDPDFTTEIAELGLATRRLHEALGERLGTGVADRASRARLATALEERLVAAVVAVPTLAASADRIRHRYATALDGELPPLQRIHGDLHLGQVLREPVDDGSGGRWLFIDFEGEPLRPLAERSLPDLALRDVAGMLRSLDYVRVSAARPLQWFELATREFLSGYFDGAAPSAVTPMLDALVIDKAVYEARYEAGNRPDWLEIPMDAIQRLLEDL